MDISAETVANDDAQHLTVWSGDVRVSTGDSRLRSDKLTVYALATGPRAEPAASPIRQMVAEGHVSYASGDRTASADQAVYDPASKTITLNGNAVIKTGQNEARGEKLVIDLKDGAASPPAGTGPGTEGAIRRWINAVQLHQSDEADLSPALIAAARRQQGTASQIFRAFGALQSVRFVEAIPDGDSAYEADFAHGKLKIMAGPLTADGKLDRLSWGPIWAKAGERPQPGVPLAP